MNHSNHYPICVKCQTAMTKKENGAVAIDMAGDPQEPYCLIHCDVFECKSCGAEVASGFAIKGTEKHESHFAAALNAVLTSGRLIVRNYERGKVPKAIPQTLYRVNETFVNCPGCQYRYLVERIEHFFCINCQNWNCYFFNIDNRIVARWFNHAGQSKPVDQPTNFWVIE